MRPLNLSALTQRARASQASFFIKEQASQTKQLQESLPISKTSSKSSSTPSVDTLSEISAHSASLPLIRAALQSSPKRPPSRPKPSSRPPTTPPIPTIRANAAVDPSFTRALGTGRLRMVPTSPTRVVTPGGEKYAEGVVLGIGAFGVATMIVGGVGIAGAAWMWNDDRVVAGMRDMAIGMREDIDERVGERVRRFASALKERGQTWGVTEWETARKVAQGVGGTHESHQDEVEGEA